MTVITKLLFSDLMESSRQQKEYWRSSSLPVGERFLNSPSCKRYRRDKALKKIINRDMAVITSRFAAGITVKGEDQ